MNDGEGTPEGFDPHRDADPYIEAARGHVRDRPLDAFAHSTLARMLLAVTRREEALWHISIGLALDPDSPELCQLIAAQLREQGAEEVAAVILERGWKRLRSVKGDRLLTREQYFAPFQTSLTRR